MSTICSLNDMDSLLFQLALQTRELVQKKHEINQQIKVCRVNIAERRSCIDTMHQNITKLEEEINAMQSTVMQNKVNAKSMKATNCLLLQYEQTLKAELESRRTRYLHDLEVYEEKMSSCRKTFQSHKEYYLQEPLAQELLKLQTEKEEIEHRIKTCDDHIAGKQKELDLLTAPAVSCVSTETPPGSDFGQQLITEEQTKMDSDSSIDISSLHLSQTACGHKAPAEANAEDIPEQDTVQDSPTSTSPDKASIDKWSFEQINEQSHPDEMNTETPELGTSQEDQPPVSALATVEDEIKQRAAVDEEQAPSESAAQGNAASPPTALEKAHPQSLPEKPTAAPSTPTFAFNFSPSASHGGGSDAKSPAFLFSLSSDPSTPGFSGFDVGSSMDEDSSFAFAGAFFSEKKATEVKPSSCPEFLFDQAEQSEDFQFAFPAKSPQSANNKSTRDEFPFSFNF
ncbi:uncharacterized protein ACNS7B_024324 isoform 2-T2 [Menidia menidia]